MVHTQSTLCYIHSPHCSTHTIHTAVHTQSTLRYTHNPHCRTHTVHTAVHCTLLNSVSLSYTIQPTIQCQWHTLHKFRTWKEWFLSIFLTRINVSSLGMDCMTCCTSSSVTSTNSQLSSSLGSGLTPPLVTQVCCCKRQTVVSIPPEYSYSSFV